MEKKVLFIIFSIVLISISPQIFANDELDALLAEKNAVLIEHKLNFSYDAETFEESKYIILNQKLGNYDLIVEYTLDNFMELDYGLWSKELKSEGDIIVMIGDDIELIFVNSRPIDVSDAKGINCIGCNMILEYFDNEEYSSKEIFFSNDKFTIDFLSNGKISEMEFIGGGAQLLNFDVIDKDQLFVIKIPLEYLLNPFEVYFTENDDMDLDQVDKIRKTEFSQDETHVNVSFRTFGEGTVSIVGATPEEHQKKLEQIENIKAEVKSEPIEEREKGIALPIPGTKAASELAEKSGQTNEEEMMNKLSFADELEKGAVQNSEDNTIIVAIVVGIVIAGIIGGVIFKLKKN